MEPQEFSLVNSPASIIIGYLNPVAETGIKYGFQFVPFLP